MRKVCTRELIRRGLKLFFLAEYVSKCGSERVVHCLPRPARQGPVVQSIVTCSLTSSLRGQLVKYFTTLLLNTLIFFVEKMREAFALQKLLTLFQQNILAYIRY